jgi:lysophospholipase L1-like esterase
MPPAPRGDESVVEDTAAPAPDTAAEPREEPAPSGDGERRPNRFVGWLEKLPKKLALLAIAVVVTLVVLEGVFRLFGYRPLYDEYSKPDQFFVHDRVLGWRNRPGARGEFVGPVPFPVEFRTPIRINSLGLRGGEIKDVAPGGKRVVVIGDSQAAGFEVPEHQTYEALLQRRLTNALGGTPVQVINAGVRGYGTDQELLEYERQIRKLHPDIVVLHFSANDPDDNTTLHRTRRPFGKAVFVPRPDGSLRLVDTPVRDYPLCSYYRLDETFRVRRADSFGNRSFCWVESTLTDRSALFSFITTRIQTNPTLVRWLHGLGSPGDQETAGQPPASTKSRASTPSSTAATTAASPVPSTAAAPAPAPSSGAATVQGSDYRDVLTSRLILRLASEVQQDGAKFVILTQNVDLSGLDVGAFERAGINIQPVDQALGPDQSKVRFANDGHFNARGHRAVASALVRPLAYLLAS